ncbi:hypothetical protein GCM10023322_39040 [Rugosimonospora acidiphila]|uniref:YD repeat-containing protein n=1 Tax=Rugosimonospora acidiphila TaxID=556531 RepID=A0ABP9RXN7_9ACTN
MTEEDRDFVLRDLLSGVSAPPTRVDLNQVITVGRRSLRRRRSFGVAGVSALVVAAMLATPLVIRAADGPSGHRSVAAPIAAGAPRATQDAASATPSAQPCAVTALPSPNGLADVEASAVDPTGRYVGGQAWVGQNGVPILWTGGRAQVLPVHAKSATVDAINANGVVVGQAENSPDDQYVYRYQNGTVTKLSPLPHYPHLFPTASINAAGDVVINAEAKGSVEGAGAVGVIWPAGSTTAHKVTLPAGANLFAITDDGTRVGTSYVAGVADAAYTWDANGHGRKLAAPSGQKSLAYGARGEWVTGAVGEFPGASQTARWNLRTGSVTILNSADNGGAVNASGWVVTPTAVIPDKNPIPLQSFSADARVTLKGISDTNLVVGYAAPKSRDGHSQAVTWQC